MLPNLLRTWQGIVMSSEAPAESRHLAANMAFRRTVLNDGG